MSSGLVKKTVIPCAYTQYYNLYTSASALNECNKGRIIRRGRKSNYWALNKKQNDKLDIYDARDDKWHICTIKSLEKKPDRTIFFIKWDGWSAKWDEYITIVHADPLPTKLKPLHTVTPHHLYLKNPSLKPCAWNSKSKWVKCTNCGRKCCMKCLGVESEAYCFECVDEIDHNRIYDALYEVICDQYSIEIYVMHFIADYAMGIVLQCSNTHKNCTNEINFKYRYELDYNLRNNNKKDIKIYQYSPKYLNEGSHISQGKYRRIFCEDCTKYELEYCSCCYGGRDVKPKNYDKSAAHTSPFSVKCHNHKFVKCTLCDKIHDLNGGKVSECEYCNKIHCKTCDTEYIRCAERMQSEKDMEFDQIRNAVSTVKDFAIDCENVINAITEYSLGVAVTCSNTNNECQHEIIYDSKYEFDLNVSKCRDKVKNIKMYQYSPKFVHDDGTHLIYSKMWRTFCEHCTANELVRCKSCWNNREAKPKNYRENAYLSSAESVKCHNHNYVECTLCKKQYDLAINAISSCQYCDTMHCNACQRELKTTEVPKCVGYGKKTELDKIFGALKPVLHEQYQFSDNDEKVIHILSEYSCGLVVACSNAMKKCQNEINFDFKGQIVLNSIQSIQNPNGVAVYSYCPKYPTSGTIEICGKNRRIFCEDCTENELVECRCCDSGKEPKPKNYDPFATGYSITASKCNNHKFVPCSICHWEYEEGDRVKVEWCAKCGSNHCSKCMKESKCTKENKCPSKDNNNIITLLDGVISLIN